MESLDVPLNLPLTATNGKARFKQA